MECRLVEVLGAMKLCRLYAGRRRYRRITASIRKYAWGSVTNSRLFYRFTTIFMVMALIIVATGGLSICKLTIFRDSLFFTLSLLAEFESLFRSTFGTAQRDYKNRTILNTCI
jgi:hypothetical protein